MLGSSCGFPVSSLASDRQLWHARYVTQRLSDEQVALVLQRAADLQSAGTSQEGGMSIADVELIAKEAGIDVEHVRRAATELPLLKQNVLVETSKTSPPILGAPTQIAREFQVPRELNAQEMEQLIEAFESVVGENGAMEARSDALKWTSHGTKDGLIASIRRHEGRTSVRIQRTMNVELGSTAATVFALGALATFATVALSLVKLHAGFLALGMLLLVPTVAVATAISLCRKVATDHDHQLERALQAMQVQALQLPGVVEIEADNDST